MGLNTVLRYTALHVMKASQLLVTSASQQLRNSEDRSDTHDVWRDTNDRETTEHSKYWQMELTSETPSSKHCTSGSVTDLTRVA